MPTPFMHLQIAERILHDDALGQQIGQMIHRHYSAFYFGNIAPDYQTICNVPRATTHFYDLPPGNEDRAYPEMLASFPELAKPLTMKRDQAVFVAAYCAHLMLDLRWYHEVLIPFFVESQQWKSHHQRFVVHNTLLTYLDRHAVSVLPAAAGNTLSEANPKGWLPFAQDWQLTEWRDLLVAQLRPGTPLRTIEIYADRLLLTQEEFAGNLDKPEWMDENLFTKVPIERVQETMTSAVAESVGIINNFLMPLVTE